MMRNILLLGLSLACLATPALAISRYNSLSFTCAGAVDILRRERAVIFRYPARRTSNMTLYDRFVLDGRSCDYGYYAKEAYIPTKDTPSCRLFTCEPTTDFDHDHDHIIFPHHHR